MLNLAKRLAKVFKGIVRPKTTKAQVAIPQRNSVPTVPAVVIPTREESTARLAQILQAEVDRKLKAFLDAVENYPYRWAVDAYLDDDDETAPPEITALVFAFEGLGFACAEDWLWGGSEYDILCAAIEYHQQDGDEITLELITDVVEQINDGYYTLLPEVANDEDLGAAVLDAFQESGHHFGLGWLIDCVDCELLGESWRETEGGVFLDRGYFQFGKITF